MNTPNPNLNSIILKEVKDDVRQNVHQIRIRHRTTAIDAQRKGITEFISSSGNIDDNEETSPQRIYTESDITGISSRIKRRRQADKVDLENLSNAFIQDEQFCSKFINIPGALQVLIKELINTSDSDRKLLAIECICNLTGGNDFVCEKVAIASTFYLMSNLTSLDETVKTMSVYALANLTRCLDGEKTLNILNSYRIVPKLLELLKHGDAEKMDSEFNSIVLDVILRVIKTIKHVEDSLLAYHYFCSLKEQTPKTIKIIYLLFSSTNFGFINTYEKIPEIISSILMLLREVDEKSNATGAFDLIVSIRMLANLIGKSERATESFISWFQERSFEQIYISTIFGKYLSHREISVRKETLWLLGNLYCCNYPVVQSYIAELDNFVDTLTVADELLNIFLQPLPAPVTDEMDMDG